MSDWKQNLHKTRYVMDAILLLSFLIVSAPQSTGTPGHEWLSLLFVIPFVIHLLLHWEWAKQSFNQLFAQVSAKQRFNTLWNYLLYITMLIVIVSGFLVSVALLPTLGLDFQIQDFWSKIHHDAATLIMPMLGIHLAQHLGWVVKLTKRMFGQESVV